MGIVDEARRLVEAARGTPPGDVARFNLGMESARLVVGLLDEVDRLTTEQAAPTPAADDYAKLRQAYDAAIARAEKAEAERDEARQALAVACGCPEGFVDQVEARNVAQAIVTASVATPVRPADPS